MKRVFQIGAALTLLTSTAGAQVVVTPSNPNGWGIDPYRGAPTGTQAITNEQAMTGSGSLHMTVKNDGATRTGYGIFAAPNTNFGLLSNLTTLSFDWRLGSTAIQSPTLRLYLDVANPMGGRMVGQFAWYADNAINGPALANTTTSTNLLDGDGNNNFFLRFFGGGGLSSGQIATSCVNADRANDFNGRMQGIAAWFGACTGSGGTVNLADASITGFSFDMGAYPGDGSQTYDAFIDNLRVGSAGGPVTSYNFEADAVSVVPEPASVVLVGAGLVGMFGFARRRRIAK